MSAQQQIIDFVYKGLHAKISADHGRGNTLEILKKQFDHFPNRNASGFPDKPTKIRKRNYFEKRYRRLIETIMTTSADSPRHKYAQRVLLGNAEAFDTLDSFDAFGFVETNILYENDIYNKLERLITVYHGTIRESSKASECSNKPSQ
ncbi:MAG: hypothetical protein ACLFUB_16190 [Cyclobacteriaceae bacterium]